MVLLRANLNLTSVKQRLFWLLGKAPDGDRRYLPDGSRTDAAPFQGGYTAVRPLWDRLPDAFQITLNLSLVSLGWVFFMFDMSGAMALLASVFGTYSTPEPGMAATAWAAVFLAFILCQLIKPEALAARASASTSRMAPIWIGSSLATVFVASLTLLDLSETFIYFRF